MKPDSLEVRQRIDNFKLVLTRAKIKLTHQRLKIFHEIASREDHPDAESIFRSLHKKMPTLSLDTVYRTLWLLSTLSLIRPLSPKRDSTRFEANLKEHPHFVCENCGFIGDLEIRDIAKFYPMEEKTAFGKVSRVCVEFRGVCTACIKKLP